MDAREPNETRAPLCGEELTRLIAVGLAEADRGELLDAEAVFEEIRQRSDKARRSQSQ